MTGPKHLESENGGRGALVVLEGCDHSGKSTQCKRLVECLQQKNIPVKPFRFPDRRTSIGQMINGYLGNKQDIEDHAVHLLFSANRWELVPRMKTLLEEGTTLIVDRYAFSGVAFTAAKQGFTIDWCKQPDIGLPRPDLVLFLNLSADAAAKRGTFGNERYEQTDFQVKVANNFLQLKEPYWQEIDADKPENVLTTELEDILLNTISNVGDKPLKKLWCD
ncbi:thymidylate kinase-like [Ostrea edulis]|uniref:thymidylate kinase-like n=1 Tax=Ostrea edulis TaxID=37623 RepID=UPI0024AFC9C9|nr:thymidylate kinase-like [Ostrea edulis]